MVKIRLENVTYYYPDAVNPALQNINLIINRGDFVLLVGSSGSGKSTLLRSIAGLIPNFYPGKLIGQVLIDEVNLNRLSPRQIADKIALLFQEVEAQMVKNQVENEIAFSLENLGINPQIMKQRVAEISNALNLVPYLGERLTELSGGMKQRVVLAATLVRQPDILLLDEPISQLDPIAAKDLLSVIRYLHEELGITVIIAEHRLESIISMVTRVVAMEEGEILYDGAVGAYPGWAVANNYRLIPDIPKLFAQAGFLEIPLNVQVARQIIANPGNTIQEETSLAEASSEPNKAEAKAIITFKNVSYKYSPGLLGVKNINISFPGGETSAIIGHNGAGKSTLLKLIASILKADKGQVLLKGRNIKRQQKPPKIGYVPQNPDEFLYLSTVEEELSHNLSIGDKASKIESWLHKFNLTAYRYVDPRDLSLGEKQLVVLAAVLIHEPEIICLDEPTRGLDYSWQSNLGKVLAEIKRKGTTIIMVTNDIEFIAKYTDNIAIMSKGEVIDFGDKYDILTKATFYAPQVNRVFRQVNNSILTYDDAKGFLLTPQVCEGLP